MDDSTSSILRSAKRFFSGTMLSRIAGMLRDMAMAFAFGTQESVAAFLVAFRFSHLLRRLLGEGALQSAMIPQFERFRQENAQKAADFFRNLTCSLIALLSFIVIVTMGVLWGILQWGHLEPGNVEIVELALLMMPSLVFICLFGINASLLQCEKSYFTPSVAPVAFNLFWIFGVLLLKNFIVKEAMLWLTLFVNLACAAQWALTVPQVCKSLKSLGKQKNSLKLFSADVLSLIAPLSLGVVGVGAAQINNALDAVFARYADAEGPAYLWYAIRIQQLPLALFGVALSGALLPPLSRAIKTGKMDQFREFLDFALRRTAALMIPVSAALFVLGDSCINLIYGHGDFDQTATAGTTLCLWAYGAGLIPMTVVLILAPSFYAQQDYKTPTKASTYCILLNIFLNYLMVNFFAWGAPSIAIATSVSAWVNMFILGWKLQQKCDYMVSSHFKKSLWKICFASLIGMGTVWIVNSWIFNENPFALLITRHLVVWPRELFDQGVRLLAQIITFSGAVLGIAYLLNAEDILYVQSNKNKTINANNT